MSVHTEDAALDTLFLPFVSAELPWPEDGALFLRARFGAPMQQRWPGLVCEQTFKPDAAALQRAGVAMHSADGNRRYALVLILPPRQRDEARALFARAVTLLAPGGRIVASMSNNEGARSGEADLEQLTGNVSSVSKHKCRVFWTDPLYAPANTELHARWLGLDAPRTIADARFVSRPGVFAWDRIDAASALLAAHLPDDLHGEAADLGAGFGYLAVELLSRCRGVVAVDLYEAEQRALQLAEHNLACFAPRVRLGFHWHDVTGGLPRAYDVIVTNPPFHTQSRIDRPDVGKRFIVAAAQALRPGGRLWLVANRHLPYESVLDQRFGRVRTVAQQQGFKIIEAVKGAVQP